MQIKAIVNVNESWGIGKDGDLLTFIPEDMKFFRTATKGQTVIMGRKTLLSFPGTKPLKGRLNLVLTKNAESLPEAARAYLDGTEGEAEDGTRLKLFSDVSEVISFLRENEKACADNSAAGPSEAGKPKEAAEAVKAVKADGTVDSGQAERCAYIIGGEQIYRAFLPYCSECLVTKNDCKCEADTFFPNLDELLDWYCSEESEAHEHEGVKYRFTVYKKKG